MSSSSDALPRTLARLSCNPAALAAARASLTPTGVLRAAINMSNSLLVTGRDDSGGPTGVSPALARALARALGVPAALVAYAGPAEVVAAARRDEWDVANVAADAARGGLVFSAPYVEIESCFLVKAGSAFRAVGEVDAEGVVVLCKEGAAYTLWLRRNFGAAELCGVESVERGLELFCEGGERVVLAGLRARLVEDAEKTGGRVLEDRFCVASQAVAVREGRDAAGLGFVDTFLCAAVETGLVEALILENGVKGKIAVAR